MQRCVSRLLAQESLLAENLARIFLCYHHEVHAVYPLERLSVKENPVREKSIDRFIWVEKLFVIIRCFLVFWSLVDLSSSFANLASCM